MKTKIRAVKWLAIFAIWTLFALAVSPFVFYALPDIESRAFPVLTNQKVERLRFSDDGEFLMFDWTYTKARRGYVEFAAFMVFFNRHEKYPADVFTGADCTENFRTSKSTPKGDRVTKTMCVRIPAPLRGKGIPTVRGYLEYNVGQRFYTIPTVVPPILTTDPDHPDYVSPPEVTPPKAEPPLSGPPSELLGGAEAPPREAP